MTTQNKIEPAELMMLTRWVLHLQIWCSFGGYNRSEATYILTLNSKLSTLKIKSPEGLFLIKQSCTVADHHKQLCENKSNNGHKLNENID